MTSGFVALAAPDTRVLILGTLPGAVSLARNEYYAQPHNAFWKIMGVLVGALPELPYATRVEYLMKGRLGLWDVCAAAERHGSMDGAIRSVHVNDFGNFLRVHAEIQLICFNGAKAGTLFRRHVLPTLESPACAIRQVVLPSTSPALAAMSFERKLAAWRAALQDV